MHVRYASTIRTFFVACFFFDVLPLGMLLCLVFTVIQYWTDKYMILRRYKRTTRLHKNLSYGVSWIASSCMFIVVLGHIVSKYLLNNFTNKESTISLRTKIADGGFLFVAGVISLINFRVFMSKRGLLECLFKRKSRASIRSIGDTEYSDNTILQSEGEDLDANQLFLLMQSDDRKKPYWEIWIDLDTDYDRMNPITAKKAIQDWKTSKLGTTGYAGSQLTYNDQSVQPYGVDGNPSVILGAFEERKNQSAVIVGALPLNPDPRANDSLISVQNRFNAPSPINAAAKYIQKLDRASIQPNIVAGNQDLERGVSKTMLINRGSDLEKIINLKRNLYGLNRQNKK
jgi:hypothetical protein